MDELARLARVLRKHAPPESKCERLLVIDATTGQNGYRQAQSFREATELTGMVLSKLDGTAKGGIVLAIAHGLDVPIRYVGTGEGIDDLGVFDADKFAGSLAA
jgi:fused signal recognition particle receptor